GALGLACRTRGTCCSSIGHLLVASGAKSARQAEALIVEQKQSCDGVIDVDDLGSVCGTHRPDPVERGENARVARGCRSGCLEVALGITEVTTPECEEGEPLQRAGVGCIALQRGEPGRAGPFIVALVSQDPADQVVCCSEGGISGSTSLRNRQRGLELASLSQPLAEIEERQGLLGRRLITHGVRAMPPSLCELPG